MEEAENTKRGGSSLGCVFIGTLDVPHPAARVVSHRIASVVGHLGRNPDFGCLMYLDSSRIECSVRCADAAGRGKMTASKETEVRLLGSDQLPAEAFVG